MRAMKRAPLVLVVLAATAVLADSKLDKEEKQDLPRIAAEWVELGHWCAERNLLPQARLCADHAAAAAPQAPDVVALVAAVSSGDATPQEKDVKEWPKKLQAAGKKLAPLYDRIVAAGAGEVDAKIVERVDGWFLSALEVDPSAHRWEKVMAFIEDSKDGARAERIADRALAFKPPEKWVARLRSVGDAAAIQGVVLKTASTHPLRYFLSLPKGYERRPGKKWPVFLYVDGSGSLFEEGAKAWRDNRGKLGMIIVAPCTFSNTGRVQGDEAMARYRKWYSDAAIEEGSKKRLEFDEEGLLAVIKDLEKNYDAESRIYMTGFSGGGTPTYMMIWKHPDLLAAAAPVCAVSGRGAPEQSSKATADDKSFPIHIITGEQDPRMIPGSDAMAESLKNAGYADVKRTTVPGMGHKSAIPQVIATFKPYIEGEKKRSDKQ